MNRLKTIATTIALAGAAFAVTGTAFARQHSGTAASAAATSAGKAGAPSKADRNFVMKAAKAGMTEVALGKLAQRKGASDAVKQFGAHMVEDHGKANDKLEQLAASKDIKLPASPPKDAKAQKLESMSGAAFDRAYMADMLAAHKKAIALFEKEAQRKGADPEIKAFAVKTLPTLKSHLQMLQADEKHAGAAGAAGKKH